MDKPEPKSLAHPYPQPHSKRGGKKEETKTDGTINSTHSYFKFSTHGSQGHKPKADATRKSVHNYLHTQCTGERGRQEHLDH